MSQRPHPPATNQTKGLVEFPRQCQWDHHACYIGLGWPGKAMYATMGSPCLLHWVGLAWEGYVCHNGITMPATLGWVGLGRLCMPQWDHHACYIGLGWPGKVMYATMGSPCLLHWVGLAWEGYVCHIAPRCATSCYTLWCINWAGMF